MALYLIGDVQGCDQALGRLLDTISFSPSRDRIFLLGDLVNRGPQNVAVLDRLMRLEGSARCLLGNHDLHLLALAYGVRKPNRNDTLDDVLQSPRLGQMLHWLRHQNLAMYEIFYGKPILMVHAGVLPAWSAQKTMLLAAEVENALQKDDPSHFFQKMYGNDPDHWDDALKSSQRLRVIVNSLTRLRFCSAEGQMEFKAKEGLDNAPAGFMPWFEVPTRLTASTTIAFGHWSTLGWMSRNNVLSLDTGCVWGGSLSALRIDAGISIGQWHTELIQVKCDQAQKPGQADTTPLITLRS